MCTGRLACLRAACRCRSAPAGRDSGADRTYERRRALWRWDAPGGPHPLPLSSEAGAPALSLSKRGDQSGARGRSNALQAVLARMFCPPLNSIRRGAAGAGAAAATLGRPGQVQAPVPQRPRSPVWSKDLSEKPPLRYALRATLACRRDEGSGCGFSVSRVIRIGSKGGCEAAILHQIAHGAGGWRLPPAVLMTPAAPWFWRHGARDVVLH